MKKIQKLPLEILLHVSKLMKDPRDIACYLACFSWGPHEFVNRRDSKESLTLAFQTNNFEFFQDVKNEMVRQLGTKFYMFEIIGIARDNVAFVTLQMIKDFDAGYSLRWDDLEELMGRACKEKSCPVDVINYLYHRTFCGQSEDGGLINNRDFLL